MVVPLVKKKANVVSDHVANCKYVKNVSPAVGLCSVPVVYVSKVRDLLDTPPWMFRNRMASNT